MDSLKVTDQASAAVAVAPRVALADIEEAIVAKIEGRGDIVGRVTFPHGEDAARGPMESLGVLSLCILVMRNGFTVIGKAAPASAENFNRELGRQYAYEDAIRQLWPLMGYALRDKLAEVAGQ